MYEVEVLKMNSVGYALKRDVEALEAKSLTFAPSSKVTELAALCRTFAPITDLGKTNDLVGIIHDQLQDYSLKKAVDLELRDLKTSLTQEIRTKVNKSTFVDQYGKIESMIQAGLEEQQKEFSKVQGNKVETEKVIEKHTLEISWLNRKFEQKLDKDELKGITDTFKKFASYDDMRDLYNRCIPEI